MGSRLKVTVEDLDTGDTETRVLENDWMVIVGDPWEIASLNAYGNGTTQLTIKRMAQEPV